MELSRDADESSKEKHKHRCVHLPTGEAVGWEFDRTVEVGWTVELFSGKKNPVLVGEDSGSASVNVPHSGGDPCTLGT